jgi:hypothetical protein
MPLRFFCFFLGLLAAVGARGASASAGDSKLLDQAVDNWMGARDQWAFTQRAVEYDNGKAHERVERYDPAQPLEARWTLLTIDAQKPTPEQHAAWAKKKAKHRTSHKFETGIGDFFDFTKARVVTDTEEILSCEVPLRTGRNWLFESEKVKVVVTINKKTQALDRVTAHIREPVKVLFGIAKITDGQVDLRFQDESPENPETAGPGDGKPKGSVHMNVTRFGERAEFTWSDFKRVAPAPASKRSAR